MPSPFAMNRGLSMSPRVDLDGAEPEDLSGHREPWGERNGCGEAAGKDQPPCFQGLTARTELIRQPRDGRCRVAEHRSAGSGMDYLTVRAQHAPEQMQIIEFG